MGICLCFNSFNTQQKITDVKRLTKYFGRQFAVRLLSVCCPMYRMTNVPVHYLCTGTFVHKSSTEHLCTNSWQIFWTSVCCLFVHKRLTDISERKGKEKSMKIKKITLKEKANNYHRKKSQTFVRYVGQQTVVRCFSAQTVAWADIYPFAVRGSDVRFLSVCCPFAVQNFLLCNEYQQDKV